MERNLPPGAARASRVLGLTAVALAAVGVAAIVLIAAGAFDPKPFGDLILFSDLEPATLSAAGSPKYLPQPAPWPVAEPPLRFSLRLTSAYESGELDSGFGLAVGGQAGRLIAAVSPLGYATVVEMGSGGEQNSHFPWQPWPHVRLGAEDNEIWLDVDNARGGARVTVWVNREQLWQGVLEQPLNTVELWGASFAEPVIVNYQTLEWYAGPPTGDPR